MRVHSFSTTVSTAALLALGAWAPSYSQQFSKDSLAPYIPSPQEVVDRMLSAARVKPGEMVRSEEHTSELQSLRYLLCRLLLEKRAVTCRQRSIFTGHWRACPPHRSDVPM